MGEKISNICLFLVLWIIYLYLQSKSIFGGDAGDLVTAAYVWGIPHSPGYPLYTFIGAILIRFVPLFTAAWRVSLISSFFASLSVTIFFVLLKRLTRNPPVSLVGSLLLSFLYPFWLYAEVPEVFSFAVFFMLFLFYLGIQIREKQKFSDVVLFVFFSSLSFTHHHTIIFVYPALITLLYPVRKKIIKSLQVKNIFILLGVFLLGLTPLLYLPLVSRNFPPIDWEHPTDIAGFFRLFFRTTYGTFKAGAFATDNPLIRVYSYLGFWKFFIIDLKNIGIVLFILGVITSVRKNIYYSSVFIGFLSYSFFLFYASFPLFEEFSLATYERFTIFPYIFAIVFITAGIQFIVSLSTASLKKYTGNITLQYPIILFFPAILFIVYPLSLFIKNIKPIAALTNNYYAEDIGRDILASAGTNSLLLLVSDTAIFHSQYIYFTGDYYGKTRLFPVHLYKLFRPYYHESLKKLFPDIVLPNRSSTADEQFIFDFMTANTKKFPVFTNFYNAVQKDDLIPHGLLWQYIPDKSKQPSVEDVVKDSDRLFDTYAHIDRNNIVFQNLFLTDVLRLYSTGHQNYAYYLLEHGYTDKALTHILEAKRLTPDDNDVLFLLGLAYLKNKNCTLAEDVLLTYHGRRPDDSRGLDYLIEVSSDCLKDEKKVEKYQKEKDALNQGSTSPLNRL